MWTERNKIKHVHQFGSVDMKGSTGDKGVFVVAYDKIEILELGIINSAAGGAVTAAGVFQFDKSVAGTRAILSALATVTFPGATSTAQQVTSANLDANYDSSLLVQDQQSFPSALKGNILTLELTTQGTGAGGQTVYPYMIYRPVDANT